MHDALNPPKARISRPTRRVQHLALSRRTTRRKHRRFRPAVPPAWGLSLTGVWLLCSACSFNNSFQDGCIGSIRIQVPPPQTTAKNAQPSPKQRLPEPQRLTPRQKRKEAAAVVLQAAAPTQHEATTVGSAQNTATPAQREGITVGVLQETAASAIPDEATPPPADLHDTQRAKDQKGVVVSHVVAKVPVDRYDTRRVKDAASDLWLMPPLPNAPRSAAPKVKGGAMGYSFGLLQRLWRAEAELPRSKRWPAHTRIHTLHSDVPEAIWQERPATIRLCYDSTRSNAGWNPPHLAQNTAKLQQRCQSAQPLGQGKHWFVLSDTFAASATACRLFFSPGRLAVIAECGQTLYRAPIRSFAACLQQQKGCDFAHMALERLPPKSQQDVELTPQTHKP